MNWDALGALGEIVGALAVVTSLVYLGIQIRNQNNEARLVAIHEISAGFRQSLQAFSAGNLPVIFAKANEDFDSLTDAEAIQILSGLVPMLRLWEEAFIQNERGRLESRVWDGINSQYSSYLSYPALMRCWEVRGQHFDKQFQAHVNGTSKTALRIR